MANVLRRIGKPGDPMTILGFDHSGKTIELQKGMIQVGDYLRHPMSGAAWEQNIAEPHILKENGSYAGLVYPVAIDKGIGLGFTDTDFDRAGVKYTDREITDPEDPGKVIRIERTIEYPGLPFIPLRKPPVICRLPLIGRLFTASLEDEKPIFIRSMKFRVSPIIRQLTTNPYVIGETCDSEIVKDTLSLKAKRWQLIIAVVIMFFIGFLY